MTAAGLLAVVVSLVVLYRVIPLEHPARMTTALTVLPLPLARLPLTVLEPPLLLPLPLARLPLTALEPPLLLPLPLARLPLTALEPPPLLLPASLMTWLS